MRSRKNNSGKKIAIGAVVAGVTGYVTGILTAPKSGRQTRSELADKAGEVKDGAEEQLQSTVNELNDAINKAKSKSVALSAKAREEFDETVIRAKDAQNKATQVLKAVKAGEANDPELNKAVKQGRLAVKNLRRFLKS